MQPECTYVFKSEFELDNVQESRELRKIIGVLRAQQPHNYCLDASSGKERSKIPGCFCVFGVLGLHNASRHLYYWEIVSRKIQERRTRG